MSPVSPRRSPAASASARAPSASNGSAGASIVTDANRAREAFDRVVVATHADEALALLANPSADERALLGAFRYSRNEA